MLTPSQIAARKGKLTGSRVSCLMTADARAIMNLYLEMIGDPSFVPEDLSRVWPVRLGEATEQLNLDWYEMQQRSPVVRRGEVVVHPEHEWAAATLDGWDNFLRCPIECKHVGGREPLEIIIERYQPQMQWQMECTSAEQCALSVIMGANEPIVEYIDCDPNYTDEMITRGLQFMECVWAKRAPVALDPVPAPVDASRVYDMSTNNTWADQAHMWLTTLLAADDNKSAEKVLKSIVPADAKKCHGAGVYIVRDRAGRLALREEKK